MDLPRKVVEAAGDRRSGATEIAIVATEGLLDAAGDPALLAASAAALVAGQPAMAPMWHLAAAARAADPRPALERLLASLRADTDAAVAAARSWLDARVGPGVVATVSHSSLVQRVLAGRAAGGPALAGVLGADAIGPAELLNATGSAELAARLPTLVVATAAKLVPGDAFDRLEAPGFERIPLGSVTAVVLGGEVVEPAEAGRRAGQLAGRPAGGG